MLCRWFITVFMLLSASTLFAADSATVVFDGSAELKIRKQMQFWVAPQGTDFSQAIQAFEAGKFEAVTKAVTPISHGPVWYKFRMRIDDPLVNNTILSFGEINYNRLAMYLRPTKQPSAQWQKTESGLNYPYESRPIHSRQFAFPVTVPAHTEIDAFVEVESKHFVVFDPKLQTDYQFSDSLWKSSISSIFSFGLLAGILVYFLVVPAGVNQSTGVYWFIALTFSVIFLGLYFEGFLYFPLENHVRVHDDLLTYLLAINNFVAIMFTRHHFQLAKHSKILNAVTLLTAGTCVLSFIAAPLFGITQMVLPARIITSTVLLLMLCCGSYAVCKQIDTAGVFLTGTLGYVLGITWGILGFRGIVELTPLTYNSPLLGSVFYCLMFSAAVARRAYAYREEQMRLESQAAAAQASAKSKSAFLATMSHEIRTPINGLLGMAQMLEKTPLDKTQRYYTEIVLSSGKSLLHVINDVLDMSKVEAGKLELENEEFNLDQLLVYCGILFDGKARKNNVDISYNLDVQVPVFLKGDELRLKQIVSNLVSNAFKFTEEGSISIECKHLSDIGNDQVKLRFAVKDTGIGIRDNVQPLLFDAYSQAESSTTRNYGGTGLGLAICKQLSELMGGEIGVNSEPGEGSEFWFTAVFEIDHNKQLMLEAEISTLSGKTVGFGFQSGHFTQAISNYLNSVDANVVSLGNTPRKLVSLREKPDLLIISDHMPGELDAWFSAAAQLKIPLLLLEDNFAKDYETKDYPEDINVISMPAGYYAILHGLFEIVSGRRVELLSSIDHKEIAGGAVNIENLNILVVEDNDVNKIVIETMLNKMGVTPDFAINGEEALTLFRNSEEGYDVTLMDGEMPVMDGFQATEAMRKYEIEWQQPRSLIIALTAHALPEYAARCKAVGMDDVLTKPLDYKNLATHLEAIALAKETALALAAKDKTSNGTIGHSL